jgi:hypothetical protein
MSRCEIHKEDFDELYVCLTCMENSVSSGTVKLIVKKLEQILIDRKSAANGGRFSLTIGIEEVIELVRGISYE